jgi:hypothetical protein
MTVHYGTASAANYAIQMIEATKVVQAHGSKEGKKR